MKITSLIVLALGVVTTAAASSIPEIDPGYGSQALVLLGGASLVVRSMRRK